MIAKGKLIAFDTPENLEKNMLTSNEIRFTTEAAPEETQSILSEIDCIAESNLEKKGENLTVAWLKFDAEDAYTVSKQLFFAFAKAEKALLELSVKKANLKDIFIELAGDEHAENLEGSTSVEEFSETQYEESEISQEAIYQESEVDEEC